METWKRLDEALGVVRRSEIVKLIIVDLDDTLWRGIAAEDELSPGERKEGWPLGLADALLYFKSRGGLLAICSKNDHKKTLENFRKIYGWRITEEDFASIKINWKSQVGKCSGNSAGD